MMIDSISFLRMEDVNSSFESQSIAPTCSISNTGSESSVLVLDDTLTYDIHNIPDSDSLLFEILSRLALKSVFMFKCVCKHWLSLISQPSFSRYYISRMLTANAALSSLPFRILYRYIYETEIKDAIGRFCPASCNCSVLFLSRDRFNSIKYKILAVSNGLVLCWSYVNSVCCVCDPLTRQWVTLPESRYDPSFFGAGIVSRVNEDNVVTSYTVAILGPLSSSSNHLRLKTFSSETGEWIDYTLSFSNPVALMKRGGGPINVNGILHWFVYDHGMVAFDPCKDPESCWLIRFPSDRDVESEVTNDGIYRLCDGCQGKLRLFQVAPDASSYYCFSMWDLKDYEKGEWCSVFKVTRSDLSSCDPELKSWLMKATFVPLSFHPFDLDIVYLRCVELASVVSYSIKNRRLDVACKITTVVNDMSWRVVVPYVIPRWPTLIPIPPVPEKVFKPIVEYDDLYWQMTLRRQALRPKLLFRFSRTSSVHSGSQALP